MNLKDLYTKLEGIAILFQDMPNEESMSGFLKAYEENRNELDSTVSEIETLIDDGFELLKKEADEEEQP